MISGTLKKYILSRVIPSNAVVYSSNNATTQAIPSGTTYIKLTLPNALTLFSKHIDVNVDTREVTIKKKGKYLFAFSFSSLSNTNNIVLETVLLKNDVEISSIHMKRQFSGTSLISHATMTGAVELNKGDVLRIGVKHDSGSPINLTVQYMNILTYKI